MRSAAEDALKAEKRGTSEVAPMRAGIWSMQHALAIIIQNEKWEVGNGKWEEGRGNWQPRAQDGFLFFAKPANRD